MTNIFRGCSTAKAFSSPTGDTVTLSMLRALRYTFWSNPAVVTSVVVPESLWKRFGEVLGQKQNIRFPDDPAFSRTYRLQGDDEVAVRGLFAPTLRAHFAAHGMLHLTGFRHQVVWWRDARLPSAAELPAFLAEGDAIRRLFPKPGSAVPPEPSH